MSWVRNIHDSPGPKSCSTTQHPAVLAADPHNAMALTTVPRHCRLRITLKISSPRKIKVQNMISTNSINLGTIIKSENCEYRHHDLGPHRYPCIYISVSICLSVCLSPNWFCLYGKPKMEKRLQALCDWVSLSPKWSLTLTHLEVDGFPLLVWILWPFWALRSGP